MRRAIVCPEVCTLSSGSMEIPRVDGAPEVCFSVGGELLVAGDAERRVAHVGIARSSNSSPEEKRARAPRPAGRRSWGLSALGCSGID
eukprot:846270-Alexandrium_andersonii.AAC.1